MHFAFCAHGSNGDVLPLLAIAQRMKSNGHRATLLADHGFQTQAASCNVDYIPITTPARQKRILQDRTLLTTRYAELYMARHVVGWNQTAFETLSQMLTDDLVIVAAERPNFWADLELRRHTPVKIVRALIDLPPIASLQPRRLPETGVQRALRTRSNSAWTSYLAAHGRNAASNDRFAIYSAVRPFIPTIALWPAWIAGGPVLKAFRATFGFLPVPEFAAALKETRQGHIVFYPGTAGTVDGWLAPYLNTAAAACERIGRSGVVIGASGGPLPAIQFAPLMDLLRGASAIVHHGGIGTAAAALESGVPQIVIPRIFNQPSNAEWLRRLGVCQVVKPGKWNADTATQYLLNAIQNEEMKTQAANIAAQVNRKAALEDLCRFLENPSNY
jgi:UDP:flavonoid glycosyltransferase YjiC (YdhE family)